MRIRSSGVDLLLVGLGCPKQERWMAAHRERLGCVLMGVGAAFDLLGGRTKEAPRLDEGHRPGVGLPSRPGAAAALAAAPEERSAIRGASGPAGLAPPCRRPSVMVTLIASLAVSADSALLLLAAALFLALLTGIAYHWPVFTVGLFLLLGPLAGVLQMTPSGALLQSLSVAAIRPVDAVLTAMLAAALYRGVALAWARTGLVPTALRWTLILLAGWILLEVARNITTYGLSAPGEFRYRYLVLVMPAYVALSFTRVEQRRRLLQAAILAATVLTLCFMPLIGLTKGWAVGPRAASCRRSCPWALSLDGPHSFSLCAQVSSASR